MQALSDAERQAIDTALEVRDRGALRVLFTDLRGHVLVLQDCRRYALVAYAIGEFGAAFDALNTLLAAEALGFEDACLLMKLAATLRTDLSVREVFAHVTIDPDHVIDPARLPLVTQAARRLFEAGARGEAAALYDYVARQPDGDLSAMAAAQYGEALLAVREHARAIDVLTAADAREPLNEWSLCALADAAVTSGRFELAQDCFDRLRAMGHASAYYYDRYLDLLLKQRRMTEAAALLEDARARATAGIVDRVGLVIALHRRELDAALATIARMPAQARATLGDRVASGGYAILPTASDIELGQLGKLLAETRSTRPGALQLAIDIAFRTQDYEAARAAIDRARTNPEHDHQLLLLKMAEYHAFTGDLPQAMATIADMGPLDLVPAAHLSPIATIFAEARAWPQIIALVQMRVGDWFVFASHGAAVLGAAAAEDAWGEVIAAIERALQDGVNAELDTLRLVTLEQVSDANQLEALLEHDATGAPSGHRDRLTARIRAFSRREPSVGRAARDRAAAIYYCTDSAYLSPAINSINSLLLSNAPLLDDTAIEIFVEPEDVDITEAVAESLRAHYGCALTVTSSATLIEHFDGKLKTDYGLFTGGMELSPSAYYRIFALEQMLDQDNKQRALYIDSDTIVTGEISRAFAALDGRAPLAARIEVDKFEVRRVEKLHGLAAGSYFNSGVLAIDMAHPDLRARLAETMLQITDNGDALVYHDQCALNLGFAGATVPLPPQFNSFCTSWHDLASPGAAGIILHFLDRPKPWQAGYGGAFGVFWYRYWQELAKVVDRPALDALVQRSNV